MCKPGGVAAKDKQPRKGQQFGVTSPKPCPIPRTHRRLGDVFAIWSEALASYPDPEDFRRKVNSLLQESRAVTWRLQNDKHVIPDFDSWYAPWVRRMKDSEVMSWAESMRTHVVHTGDLEARSVARVSVLAAWDSPAAKEIEVPPMLGPAAIAELVRHHTKIPAELLKDAVAIVERRWVVDSLPHREILEALADCYVLLHELVAEAHQRCGASMTGDSIEAVSPTWPSDEMKQDRPSVMVLSEEVRTTRLQLATGERITAEHRVLEPTAEDMERAGKRWDEKYGGMPEGHPGKIPETSADLFALAEWHVDVAKRVLAGDGYHNSMVFTFGPGGIYPQVMLPEDRTQKYLLWNRLAERVERHVDWAVLSVGEVWLARGDPAKLGIDPTTTIRGVEDLPNREEALFVAAAHRDGQARSYTVPFTRDSSGKVAFEKVWLGYAPSEAMNFFIPVMKVWQAWRRNASGSTEEPLFVDSRPKPSAKRG